MAVLCAVVTAAVSLPVPAGAYQVGGTISGGVQTGYSGLTTTITTTGSITNESWATSTNMDSGRDWSVNYLTYTPDVRSEKGLQWYADSQGCTYPGSNSTASGCSKGTVTFTFSRPVVNPVLHVNDFGGRMDAGCILAVQGTLALSSATPATPSMSKVSGRVVVSGSNITGASSTPPTSESNHSSGSVQLTGTVKSLTFSMSLANYRSSGTCSYDQSTMQMSSVERLNVTFSYGEDYGDGPASYDGSAAATHVLSDLRMGGATVSAENTSTANTSAAPVASSPIASSSATGDNDDAVTGSPAAALIGQDYSLTVPVSGASQAGQVCGYLDMDNNGSYSTVSPNERACATFAAGAASSTITWTASQWPAGAAAVAATGLRLRAAYGTSPTGAASPTGPADSGEVEDHRVQILSPLPPVAQALSGTATQDANQTFTPATSQGSIDTARTCIVSGATCTGSLVVDGQGTYTVNGNGTVTFDPLPGFTGTATPVNYRIEDASGNRSTSTISPVVVAAPTAGNDTVATTHNTAAQVTVLGNDASSTGSALTGSSVRLCGTGQTPPSCTATSVTVSGKGTFVLDTSTGVVTFTPLNTFSGTASVDYQVTDSLGGVDSATVTVTVAPPAAPAASPAASVGALDANQTVTLPASAGAGTSLDASRTCIVSGGSCVRSLVVPGEGTYTVNSDGTVTFDPLSSFTGTATQQTYRVEDLTGQQVTSTLTLTVAAVPVPVNDVSTGAHDTNQTVGVLTNDAAGTGTTLVPATVRICTTATATASCSGTSLSVAGQGTYTVNSDGTVTFDPLPAFTGTATPVKYVVSDALGQRGAGTVTPSVQPPAAPVATPEQRAVLPGGSVSFTTVSGSSGLTAGAGLVSAATSSGPCLVDPSDSVCKTSVTVAGRGTWSIDQATGVATFAASASAPAGSTSTVQYRVTDVVGQTGTSTLTAALPVAPVATSDTSSGPWNTAQSLAVLSNDTVDPAVSADASSVRLCGVSPVESAPGCTKTALTVTGEGTYAVGSGGVVTFVPEPAFLGAATPVRYVMSDSLGQTANATLAPTVVAPAAPTAGSQTRILGPGESASFSPLTGNGGLAAAAPGGPALDAGSVCIVNPVTNVCGTGPVTVVGVGTYSIDVPTGVVTFVSLPDATAGPVTPVAYRVTDSIGRTVSGTLAPTVQAGPVAADDSSRGAPGLTQTVAVTGNDGRGADGTALDPASVRLCGAGENAPACTATKVVVAGEGTYSLGPNGAVLFSPVPAFVGKASGVAYSVADTKGRRSSAMVLPYVVPPPAPVARPDTARGAHGQTVRVNPLANDAPGTPPAGAAGGVALVPSSVRLCGPGESAPACSSRRVVTTEGTYTVSSLGVISFVPAPGFRGTATQPVTYQVTNDWRGRSGPGTSTSVFTPVISPPKATAAGQNASQARAVDRVNWTRPGRAVYFNPTFRAVPSEGSRWLESGTKILASPSGAGSLEVVTTQGTWTVVRDNVRFVPAAGFLGAATVRFVVTDSSGATASAALTAIVSEDAPILPETGTRTDPLLWSCLLCGLGLVIRCSSRRSRSGRTRAPHP